MTYLSEEERNKIVEEERIRADERAKYSQPQPQEIVIKQKQSFGLGKLLLLLFVIWFLWILMSSVLDRMDEARESVGKTTAPLDVTGIK